MADSNTSGLRRGQFVMQTRQRMIVVLASVALGWLPTIAPDAVGQQACVGDCNRDATVAINELVLGVNILLGTADINACSAFDPNGSGTVTINELIQGVNNAQGGCAPDPVTRLEARRVVAAPMGIDDPLWDEIKPLAPELRNVNTNLLYGDGQLNMNGTFAGLDDFNGGQPADLELRAVHDGTNIYILAEWNDTTFNLDRNRWLYNGPSDPLKPGEPADGWTSQLNDDKIGLAFEIEPASSLFGTFPEVGCAASCHQTAAPGEEPGLDMRPAEGKVDIWRWNTSRSEPLGYVQDQVTGPDAGRTDDAGIAIAHRNRPQGGNNRSGPQTEWDGTLQEFERWDGVVITLDPAYVILDGHRMPFEGDADAGEMVFAAGCAVCHGSFGEGGIGPALTDVKLTRRSRAQLDEDIRKASHPGASTYLGLSEQQMTDVFARLRGFAGIPGYYLKPPEGSVGDIVTQSNVDYTLVDEAALMRTHYRLLMIRALDTGHDDDAQFTPGNEYPFGVALMDNDGRNHIGSRREILFLEP